MTRLLALLSLLALPAAASAAPPLAAGGYWQQFSDYWLSRFREQSGMVLLILAVGAVAIGIIVLGNKWKK